MGARLEGRRILLIVGGGIAAYKSLELVRHLTAEGAELRCVMTRAAQAFVTPLSFAALSGQRVHTDLFDSDQEAQMGHIHLSRASDLILCAPATANRMAQMALGLADDLAGALLLAARGPILLAPAMNVRMWEHPATQEHLRTLRARGVLFAGPEAGGMACGEEGEGRMAEAERVAEAVCAHFAPGAGGRAAVLSGITALVTSGPTREAIDAVRYLANHSSGKQGHAVAGALADLGARTILVSGPCSTPPPPGVELRRVETAQDMLAAAQEALPVDVAVCAAAVCDWRIGNRRGRKIKKGKTPPVLELAENPDILASLAGAEKNRPALVVGFAAETEKLLDQAAAKRRAKGCDWILANDVSPQSGVLGGEMNQVHLISQAGCESWERMSKAAVAERLARRIAAHLGRSG